jgi:transposase-like protein
MGVTVRTAEIDEAIISGICQGTPLAQICRELGIDRSIVYDWRKQDEEFDRHFARAREIGHDAIADECIEISDEKSEDPSSRKVRIETRLKLLAKWDKRYADKSLVGSDPENPLPSGFAINLVKRDDQAD